jgi:hypothetical protein
MRYPTQRDPAPWFILPSNSRDFLKWAGSGLVYGAFIDLLSIVDSYAYWPFVRQVFSHGVFRPLLGRPTGQSEYLQGLEAAPRVLRAP